MRGASSLVDQLEALPTAGPTDGPSWLGELRQSAAAKLRATGLPHRKVESWRFTPVANVIEPAYVPASASLDAFEPPADLVPEGAAHLFVVDGVPLLSEAVLPDGLIASSIADVLAAGDSPDAALLRETLGQLSETEYFSALNAALFGEGIWLRVPTGVVVEQPFHVIYLSGASSEPTVAYPRIAMQLEKSASLHLIERFVGGSRSGGQSAEAKPALVNGVMEIALAQCASLEHIRSTEDVSHHVFEVAVAQHRDSRYRSRAFALGGAFSRVDLHVHLLESGAECELDGAYHLAAEERVDYHTVVEHVAPHCTSHERYRGVIDGAAVAVFDAIAKVRPNANGTEAHQENRNLLLSETARVHTKPHLEIENDEVACSHGATVGALDDEHVFYLRSRGIGEEEARAMLTYAFVGATLDRVSDEGLRGILSDAFLARLPYGDSLRGLR